MLKMLMLMNRAMINQLNSIVLATYITESVLNMPMRINIINEICEIVLCCSFVFRDYVSLLRNGQTCLTMWSLYANIFRLFRLWNNKFIKIVI